MTEPRPIFALKDWVQLLAAIGGVTATVFGLLGWLFLTWSDWRDMPQRVTAMEDSILAVKTQLASLPGYKSPELVEFRGGGAVSADTVAAGGRVTVTYVLRRVIDCPTTIRVRFWDFSTNTVVGFPDVPAVRSPVTQTFSPFAVQVVIPRDLPPGRYAYFPEIVPQACGVYGPVTPPMSDIFEVTG